MKTGRPFKNGVGDAKDTPEGKERQREAMRKWQAKYRKEHPDKKRTANRKSRYGIVDTELLLSQGGRCAACQTPITLSDPLDHCHATGKARGLVCRACNLALGHAQEDPLRLRALADYIERHRTA